MDVRDLDPIIHERVRLGILTLLLQAGELDFQTLKRELEVTDGNLAQHLRVLEEHSLIEVHKTFVGRRPRTTYTLTPEGRRRLRGYLDRLAELLRSIRRRKPESR